MRHLLLLAALALPLSAPADEGLEAERFPDRNSLAEIQAAVDQARARARAEDRLLMLVLGADWCHDSRAFADTLADPSVAARLGRRYVQERVELGFLEQAAQLHR